MTHFPGAASSAGLGELEASLLGSGRPSSFRAQVKASVERRGVCTRQVQKTTPGHNGHGLEEGVGKVV
ncbi:hypothetical protein ACFUMH_18865 [Cellulomonas sp. NPDC057328]|uniref:hypothetical protein n=1 Tax=Cellulomonas sp. NPDC057328 TaxID=3346101 RepID=UPI00363A92F5